MSVSGKTLEISDEQGQVAKRKFPNDDCVDDQLSKRDCRQVADTKNVRNEETSETSFQEAYFEPDCKICHKRFYNAFNYTEHINSDKHKRKVFKRSTHLYHCKICKKVCPGLDSFNGHLKGKFHQKHLTNLKLKLRLKLETEHNCEPKMKIREHSFYFCDVCRKKFSGVVPYDIHMSSAAHNMKVQEVVMEKLTFCQACNKSFSTLTIYESHLSTPQHLRNSHL